MRGVDREPFVWLVVDELVGGEEGGERKLVGGGGERKGWIRGLGNGVEKKKLR